METVFEHNITKEELVAVLGTDEYTKERLLSVATTQRGNYNLIYRLYMYRGDNVMAKKYADLIPNDIRKVHGTCLHDFAV